MLDDGNKTELTKKVTRAAIAYLDERGAKPIETEVVVADGWQADLAALLCPTVTELAKLKLIKSCPSWRSGKYDEWWKAAKHLQKTMTILVEVKTSRGDFAKDRKWTLPTPTNLAYLAVPKSLELDELPIGWGVLRCGDDGVRLARAPEVRRINACDQFDTAVQIAMRRDNATRYARLKEFRKLETSERNERVNRQRLSAVMRAVLAIAEGKNGADVEETLAFHGVKNTPSYLLDELKKLWGRCSVA